METTISNEEAAAPKAAIAAQVEFERLAEASRQAHAAKGEAGTPKRREKSTTVEAKAPKEWVSAEMREAIHVAAVRRAESRAVLEIVADEFGRVLAATPDEWGGEGPDMTTLWYPRDGAVAYGVWANEEEEDGDGEWRRGIEGWSLPDSPPYVEVRFRVPQCEAALRARLDQYVKNDYYWPQLRDALQRVTGE